eukprot:1766307-Amphidinium_carterae.1
MSQDVANEDKRSLHRIHARSCLPEVKGNSELQQAEVVRWSWLTCLRSMARLDDTESIAWRLAGTASGFLADAYDLFAIDLVVLILG